jgi:hypothetical protein
VNGRPIKEEKYKSKLGADVINYVVYRRTTGPGNDEVLQHKRLGITETAHVTLHPDGTVNLRTERPGHDIHLRGAIDTGLSEFEPQISQDVSRFLSKVRGKF